MNSSMRIRNFLLSIGIFALLFVAPQPKRATRLNQTLSLSYRTLRYKPVRTRRTLSKRRRALRRSRVLAQHVDSGSGRCRYSGLHGHSGTKVRWHAGCRIWLEHPFKSRLECKDRDRIRGVKNLWARIPFPYKCLDRRQIDKVTGTMTGNIYVSGRDPIFGYEHAVSLAGELNHLGIKSVQGDLIVTEQFRDELLDLRAADRPDAARDTGRRNDQLPRQTHGQFPVIPAQRYGLQPQRRA